MKRAWFNRTTLSLVILLAGCKPSAANTDNESHCIEAHLAQKGTLNLKAFDTVMKQVTLKGPRSQVEFTLRMVRG